MASAIPYPNNYEEQIELQASTVPFASAPEIYGDNIFILDKNVNILSVAEKLASEAKHLIEIFKTTQSRDMYNQFQIELQKVHIQEEGCSTYQMLLRIDSILWFKHHTLNNSDPQSVENLYKIASRYVEKVKSETEHYSGSTDEHEIERIPITNSLFRSWCKEERHGLRCLAKDNLRRPCKFDHYNWCPNENVGPTGECKPSLKTDFHNKNFLHFSNINNDEKPIYYQCRHEIIKLNRQPALCHFYVDPNFWIYHYKVEKSSSYPYFIVAARSDATPVITLNPVKHCRNETYVQTSDAWQAVLQTLMYMKEQFKLDQLPLNRIYVNFGKWMQQKVDDPTRRDCHAHINIVLTRGIIDNISGRNSSKHRKTLFPSLVGSVLPPKTHRLDDALRLIEYMNNHMVPVLPKRNQELMRSISTLKGEIETLKEEFEHLSQVIFIPTHDGQEIEESGNITDVPDTGIGINDAAAIEPFALNLFDE